jgi:hypothetical protein
MYDCHNYELLFNLGYARISIYFVRINLFLISFIESLKPFFVVLVTFTLLKIHNYHQTLFPFYFIKCFPTVLLSYLFFFYSYFIKLSFSLHYFQFNILDFHRNSHLILYLRALEKLSSRCYYPYFLTSKAMNVFES